MTASIGVARRVGAVAVGLGLGGAMLLPYVGGHPEPHADHAAHHGGVLGMVGDTHMEIVWRDGRVDVFVSDAYRRPLRARGGELTFEGEEEGPAVPLTRTGTYLTAPDDARCGVVTCNVVLEDGAEVYMTAARPAG